MAIKSHPIADVYIYDSGAEGVLDRKQQGLYYTDWFYKSYDYYTSKGYIERDADPNVYRQKLFLLKETQKLICTPYPNPITLPLSSWTQSGGTWQISDELDYTSTRYMNLDASGTLAGLTSVFEVPEGGGWTVKIRRATPKKTTDEKTTYTYIQWDTWLLVIPYNDGMSFWKYVDGDWQKVGDPVFETTDQTMNDDGSNYITVSYMNVDGVIYLSGDYHKNNWYYEEEEAIVVPAHTIGVSHKGSSFQFNFIPTMFYEADLTRSADVPFYYVVDGGLVDSIEYEKVGANEPGTTAIVVEHDEVNSIDTDESTVAVYKMTLTPEVSGSYGITPSIEAVGVKHTPQLNTYAVAYRNLAHPRWGVRLMSLSGEEGIDGDGNSWSMVLDNFDGKLGNPDLLNTADDVYLKPYKLMQIRAGHKLVDGTMEKATVFTGVILTPVFSVDGNRRAIASVRLANLSFLCSRVKAKSDWPSFDGWVIRDALEWLALKCRISTDRQLFTGEGEGTEATGVNQQLSRGTPTNQLWEPQLNETSAWEMMKKIADYIKYDLYFDRVGNLVCKPKPEPWVNGDPVDFTFYASELSLEDSESYYNATDIEVSVQGEDWYNSLWLGGYKRGGGAISAYRSDWDTIYDPQDPHYMGFENGTAAAFDYIGSQEKCEELADIAFTSILTYPQRMSFTTWFNEALEPGKTYKMTNSAHRIIGTAAKPQVYRIVSLSHQVSITGLSTTSVVGEYLGEETGA